ncbi:hypothetical protein [Mucilaginibacter sp.]|uniref:hypothetical protein n=1 Tax=Mucilaginibacter sp. TaxID=1882438 RepID=UPI003B00BCFE
MATLILKVEDSKLKMVKDVLKAIGVSVDQKHIKVENIPNDKTVRAIKDARNGKVTKAESVNELFKSV